LKKGKRTQPGLLSHVYNPIPHTRFRIIRELVETANASVHANVFLQHAHCPLLFINAVYLISGTAIRPPRSALSFSKRPDNSHYGDNRDKRKHRSRHPSERNVINMIHARQLHTLSGHATFSCAALMYGFRKRHGERRLIKGL